jgi:hypothetical protein|tara:strand:- start:72 stop:410 length:339 start_codon:yes stop_codon:yes gene_type:complete
MSIRIKITDDLVRDIKSRFKDDSKFDILKIINEAFYENRCIEEVHDSVKNGSSYFIRRGNYKTQFATETSIVDMDNKLYLLTDRLQEIENFLNPPDKPRIKHKYHLKDSNWD